MSTEWKIRAYRNEDERAALRLFCDTFNKDRSPSMQRWKFFESPGRDGRCGIYLAVAGDRIVGQFGGVAQSFKLGDTELSVMQGCDVLTAADFRRRGVLASVGRGTFDAWTAAGVDYCIGLENKEWGSRVELLDLRPCLQTSAMSLTLRPDLRLAYRLKLPARSLKPIRAALRWARR